MSAGAVGMLNGSQCCVSSLPSLLGSLLLLHIIVLHAVSVFFCENVARLLA